MDSINEKLNQYKFPIALSLVGLVLIVGGIFSSNLTSKKEISSSDPKIRASLVENTQIKVDISGAVVAPAVYTLATNSRIEDLIKLAGGFVASASAEYVTKQLNLSAKLTDGQKVYIPYEGEKWVGSGSNLLGAAGGTSFAKVGINSAPQAQLETLPGVGPATALKIINARPYSQITELFLKKAVSKSVFEKVKDLVDLN